jgi:hypothetical protein
MQRMAPTYPLPVQQNPSLCNWWFRVVVQREREVAQLQAKALWEDVGLVVSNAPTKSQVSSQDGWIVIEVAGLCHSRSGRNDLEGSKRRGRIDPTYGMRRGHSFESRDADEPQNLSIGEEWVEKQDKDERAREPSTFDRRITRPQNLTYSVVIGHIPSHEHQIWGFYMAAPYIMQVAH